MYSTHLFVFHLSKDKQDLMVEEVKIKTMETKRFWKRWITCFGVSMYDVRESINEAGVILVGGDKPGMCCWITLLLCGTSSQIKALQDAWDIKGWNWFNRMPKGAFDISTRKSVKEVIEEARKK